MIGADEQHPLLFCQGRPREQADEEKGDERHASACPRKGEVHCFRFSHAIALLHSRAPCLTLSMAATSVFTLRGLAR